MTSLRPRLLRISLGLLCFASGLAGLTYEVVWHRLLAVVLGNASFATAAVLAAVMGGMGLGALWVGPRADRSHPLRLYAYLELGLGGSALVVPALARSASDAVVPILTAVGPGWASFAIRFAIAGAIVLVPAFLLGATLPALARAAELSRPDGPDRIGDGIGVIYAANTLGAALGCVITGYFLLGAFGVEATSRIAATLDLAVGALALGLSVGPARQLGTRTAASPEATRHSIDRRVVLALAVLAGAVVLGLETVWTRVFLIVFGHDVHAFSAMLASVLTGIAIGSALYRVAPVSMRSHRLSVPLLFTALGVMALGSLGLVGHLYLTSGLDILGVDAQVSITRSESRGLVLQAIFAAATIIPTGIIAGAIFPLLCGRHPAAAAGERAGQVLAANTAGTLFGPLLTSLLLVPYLGIIGAAVALASAAVLGGLAVLGPQLGPRLGPHPGAQRGARIAVGLGAITLIVASALTPHDLCQRMLARKIGPAHLDMEFYDEGRSATVAVVRNQINGERQLFVNGINEVTTRLVHDQSFALLGHIGPLLHPDPARVAVVCLGAGLSAGAVSRHDIDELTIIDLEPTVVGGARRFGAMNHHVLDDPRTSLLIDDGRAHLRTASTRYDVIVLDSTHPRAVDSWILYTREFYQSARARLADDGILVQWLPLHGLSVDEFRVLVGTFRDTFVDATLWTNVGFEPYGQTAYTLLVGSHHGTLEVDAEALAARIQAPRVLADLDRWGLGSAEEILECLHAGPDTLARWSQGLPVNTDDHPITQFVTRYTRSAPMTPDRLLEAFAPAQAPYAPPLSSDRRAELERRWNAQGLLLAGHLERAAAVCGRSCVKVPMFEREMRTGPDYYRALGERYRNDPERLLEVASGLASHGYGASAIRTLRDAARAAPNDPSVAINLGLLHAAGGDLESAEASYARAIALDPDRALAHLDLGLTRLAAGDVDRAVVSLTNAVQLDPELASAHAALGYAWMVRRRPGADPEAALHRALALDPRHRRARANLGHLLVRRDRPEEAVEVLRWVRRYHPYDAELSFELALAYRAAGHPGAARRAAQRTLLIDPAAAAARELLESLAGQRAEAPPSTRR